MDGVGLTLTGDKVYEDMYEEVDFTVKCGFFTVSCAICTIPFAITIEMKNRRMKDGRVFWCPNGHEQCWPDGKDLDAWKNQVTELETKLKEVNQEKVQLIHQLDQLQFNPEEEEND